MTRVSAPLSFEMPDAAPPGDRVLGAIKMGHFNRDNNLDVIATGWDANSGTATLEVFLGYGDGRLNAPLSTSIGSHPAFDLRVAYLSVDDNVDDPRDHDEMDALVVTTNGELRPVFGNGDGSFFPGDPISLNGLSSVGGVDVADINGDHHLDVVVSGSVMLPNPDYYDRCSGYCPPSALPAPTIAVIRGKGDGTFFVDDPIYRTLSVVGAGGPVTVGDFNRDRIADLAIAWAAPPPFTDPSASVSGGIGILIGNGDPQFGDELPGVAIRGTAINLWSGDFIQDSLPAEVPPLLDLVVLCSDGHGGGGGSLLRGVGDGRFGVPIDIPLGTPVSPFGADLADLNDDGLHDVVVATRSGQVMVGLGNSETFVSGGVYELGIGADGAAAPGIAAGKLINDLPGGLLGDKFPDIAVALPGSGSVLVIPSVQGRYIVPQQLTPRSSQVMTGHFDGDGMLDILVVDTSSDSWPPPPPAFPPDETPAWEGGIYVRPGTGGGAFGPPIASGTPGYCMMGALADFNFDGVVDVVSAGRLGIQLRLGTGARTFVLSTQTALAAVGPTLILAAELDRYEAEQLGSQKADAIAVYQRGSDLAVVASVFHGDGAGGLGAPQEMFIASGAAPEAAKLADVTGDGLEDLVVSATGAQGMFIVLRGDGYGNFGPATFYDTGLSARGIATADLDLDGAIDVIVGNTLATGGGLRIWFGNGLGGLKLPVDVSLIRPGPSAIVTGDFDSNGTVDLAVAGAAGGAQLEILAGLGNGSFAAPLQLPVIADKLAVGDLGGDGKLDIVTSGGGQYGRISLVVNSDRTENTPCLAGSCTDFVVRPIDPMTGTAPVKITFSTLLSGGTTTVTSNAFGPMPPYGYQLGTPAQYFYINTTAKPVVERDEDGNIIKAITICIDFNPKTYKGSAEGVVILHHNNGTWEVLPPAVGGGPTLNPNIWRACATTDSLSPFALMEPIPPTELVLTATKDAVLHELEPNLNGGANAQLTVGPLSRALVGFDLSGIDVTRVKSARLVLTVDAVAGLGRVILVDVHPVLESWVEGAGENSQANTFGSGAGVTWNCAQDSNIGNRRPDCNRRWFGGVLGPATALSVEHKRGASGEVSWDVTADVLAGAGHGWLLKLQRERGGGRVDYASRVANDGTSNSASGPRLLLELLR